MNSIIKKFLFFLVSASILFSCKTGFKTSENFQLIFTDVDNFWKMYDTVKTVTEENKRIKIIKEGYFDKASLGLKKLIELDKLRPIYYSNYLRDTLFYNSIRQTILNLKKDTITIKRHIKQFSKLYTKAKFSDIYFTIGLFNHGGVILKNTMIIETQMFTKSKKTRFGFISVNNLLDTQSFISTLVHEQIHISQENKNRNSLLGDAIVEGSADFLMHLQTNTFPSAIQNTYEYGLKNEFDIWQKFKSDMKKDRKLVRDSWFYNYKVKDVLYPDLGYFIGHQICKSYYNNATDKKKAIAFLLTENDFEKILKLSKYNGGKQH